MQIKNCNKINKNDWNVFYFFYFEIYKERNIIYYDWEEEKVYFI